MCRLHNVCDIETSTEPMFHDQKRWYPLDYAIRYDTILNNLLLYILLTDLCIFSLLFTSFFMFLYVCMHIC